jgi:hypothetical protein
MDSGVVLCGAGYCRKGSVSAIKRPHARCMAPELSRSLGNDALHVEDVVLWRHWFRAPKS